MTPKRCEGVPDRHLGMFVSRIAGPGLVDDDIFVRRHRQPDVDLKSGAMAMLLARRDHVDAATGNSVIVGFKPLAFTQYLRAGGVR